MHTSVPEPGRGLPYLEVRDITAGYGGDPTITDVSLTAARGEVVVIIGPNGAGKSTLLKAMVGLLPPISGTVSVGGRNVTRLATFQLARSGIGYVPQVDDVFDPLTVAENLMMGGYPLDRAKVAQRVEEVVVVFPALAGLLPRTARKLSGGERKMVAVARALMLRPQVLLLDEPTANLSPLLARALLAEHLHGLAERGVALVIVEQRAMAALQVADWAYLMASGRVQLSAPARDLAARTDIGELFLGAVPGPSAAPAGRGETGPEPGGGQGL